MALLAGYGLFLIQHVLPRIKRRDAMLGVARMSMNWNIDDVLQHLELVGESHDSDVEKRIRGLNSRYSSKDFFQLMRFRRYEDIDVNELEGCTIVHDLNTPIPTDLHNAFDFVVEVGTIEHIFDTKTAMSSISSAVKVGGTVCHLSPMDAFNHGFYNFSLNFFYDFYGANGFANMESYLLRSARDWRKNQNAVFEPMPYTHEEIHMNPAVYGSEYDKLGIGFVAEKTRHAGEPVVPIQAAYDRNKDLQGELRNW